MEPDRRRTSQYLMPARRPDTSHGMYDIYPAHPLAEGVIQLGHGALAKRLAKEDLVLMEGFVGVDWVMMREHLQREFDAMGVPAEWVDVGSAMRDPEEIECLLESSMADPSSIFGRLFDGGLEDLFHAGRLSDLARSDEGGLRIIYGCGAALVPARGFLVYVDLPKNELQFRSRAGHVCNLGEARPTSPKAQYKRFYFVDWPVLNRHKRNIQQRIGLIVDGQRSAEPTFAEGDVWREAMAQMSRSSFRARPWFEPGPWGGTWIRDRIPGLASDVPNYAWSFELITPENGLLLESGGNLLECSFDWLMYGNGKNVLGDSAEVFGTVFPIRFDYLDTFDGGNLSVQVHPSPNYIREHFGEPFTQDETYYLMDAQPGALVFLGFQEDTQPKEFESALRESAAKGSPLDVDRYVQSLPAEKHSLYLIPHGTVHCSGTGCMVLEISATPYIFTFKMYDWLRVDLDGNPRPLNIDHAMNNLNFERRGSAVTSQLVSQPSVLREEAGGRLIHLPTHPDHFYDVHQFDLEGPMNERTTGSVHVMTVVEGSGVVVRTEDGAGREYHYAETFCVSSAAGSYTLEPLGEGPVKVVKAFVKPGAKPL